MYTHARTHRDTRTGLSLISKGSMLPSPKATLGTPDYKGISALLCLSREHDQELCCWRLYAQEPHRMAVAKPLSPQSAPR